LLWRIGRKDDYAIMCSECTPRPEDFDACTRSLLNTLQFAGDAVDFRRFCLDQTDVAEFHQGSSKGLLHDLIHFLTLSVASASKNKRPLATPGLWSQTEESEFPAAAWISGSVVVQCLDFGFCRGSMPDMFLMSAYILGWRRQYRGAGVSRCQRRPVL